MVNAALSAEISIQVKNLVKVYGKDKTIAVDDVSFNVGKGELFGLIGPDGAGKTSIFRMLTTLLLPDGGSATVNGNDVVKDYKKIRKSVGYMPGKFSLYQDLSIEENLNFFATIFGTTLEENYDLIRDIYIQIEPFKKRRAGKLSGGMKQKLALCCALIHKPTVLFLDEPTTGVDPVSRKEFWEMLKRLKAQNITILVSTPYMDEANMCDRIALIQKGKILSIDTPAEIINAYPDILYKIKADNIYHLYLHLNEFQYTKSCFTFGEMLHVSFTKNMEEVQSELLNYLNQRGHQNVSMDLVIPTIEDCFIKLLSN
ncbi:MAG: ABC transporter ATP-binding protein [Bacteroidetes bacterium]|nr:ABC transporter ATP-binding protein [Bacteroidota bacterium]